MGYLRVANWRRFQHYRDRQPPWIKLHVTMLDDDELATLPTSTRLLAVLILALAARRDNRIADSPRYLASMLNMRPAEIKKAIPALLELGFLEEYEGEQSEEKWASRYVSAEQRARVFARDGSRCVHCSATDALEIDHVLPISRGGTGDFDNLQVLCRSCNRAKRAQISLENAPQMPSLSEQSAEHSRAGGETEAETDRDSPKDVTLTTDVEERPKDYKTDNSNGSSSSVRLDEILPPLPADELAEMRARIGRELEG